MARPRGTFGPISIALLQAAETPGTVSDLARRAMVGRAAACYTASRLIDAGALQVLTGAGMRPAIVQRAGPTAERPADVLGAAMQAWRSPG